VSVYVISEVRALDEQLFARYRDLARASIAAHGGRYVVGGVLPTVLDGEWPGDQRLVIVEFPDRAAADRWYASPEYAPALQLAPDALSRRLLLADGIPGA
jgi:uncharacterized protein (DUF1330 family)